MKTDIYTLLGMIKDNKAPKKIMFDDRVWECKKQKGANNSLIWVAEDYINTANNDSLFDEYCITSILDDEVQILETTITYKQDTIKKVDEPYESVIFGTDYEFATELEKKIIDNIELIRKKQDEIIDKLNGE